MLTYASVAACPSLHPRSTTTWFRPLLAVHLQRSGIKASQASSSMYSCTCSSQCSFIGRASFVFRLCRSRVRRTPQHFRRKCTVSRSRLGYGKDGSGCRVEAQGTHERWQAQCSCGVAVCLHSLGIGPWAPCAVGRILRCACHLIHLDAMTPRSRHLSGRPIVAPAYS